MPTKPRRYHKQIPKLRFQILREIALVGELSNKKLKERLEIKHPTISEPFKVLVDLGLVRVSRVKKAGRKGGRPEKYFALTKKGLEEFSNRNPTPLEFFGALLRFYNLRLQWGWLSSSPMNSKELELYLKSYEQNYLGYALNHGYLLQSPFFNILYEQWLAEYRPGLFEKNQLKNTIRLVHSSFFEKLYDESLKNGINGIPIAQKVLECLAIHRSVTEKQINEFLNSKQKQIDVSGRTFKYRDFMNTRKLEFDYAITPDNIRRIIDDYTLSESYVRDELQRLEDIDYDSIVKDYLKFLFHCIVIKNDDSDGPRYELSLFGIILILAIITHPKQRVFYATNGLEKKAEDLIKFYNKVSQNYTEKLPLIFGKWPLLTKTWHFAYQWFYPVLYEKIEDEFARAIRPGPVPVSHGGIKEYQDAIQEISFHTTARLFDLYRGLSSALRIAVHNVESEDPPMHNVDQQTFLSALEKKQKELAVLLKYADLGKFVGELKDNKDLMQVDQHMKIIYNSDLTIVEKAFASEITFLFYINLARNKFLDYTEEGRNFLWDERDSGYKNIADYHILKPSDFLKEILKSDRELKNMFLQWIDDIRDYRHKSEKQIEEFEKTIRGLKNRKRVS
jgi:DNA-binding MarR family transcriptional regulator